MSPQPVIEVFADVWCPFAHVGLRAAAHQRALLGRTDVAIHVRAWPLELVNGTSMAVDGAAHHAHDLREQVSPDLFAHLDLDHFPTTTLPALALTAAAYRHSLTTGEAIAFALRDAMFEHGLDISDPTVLAAIAAQHGVDEPTDADRATVQADWHEGARRGVMGSPHFFCGTDDMFCPSLTITRDEASQLTITRNAERLAEFLERCLAT
jgi:predicted DsbA family dithiol-disulfide isomerase